MSSSENPIILYTSQFCGHSRLIERFVKEHQIPVHQIRIDNDSEARSMVMSINNGYASVPTLVFPDGAVLTEPSLGQLRAKLGIERSSLAKRLRGILGRDE
jgi:mycoredoxin